jgi:hypothetical protein
MSGVPRVATALWTAAALCRFRPFRLKPGRLSSRPSADSSQSKFDPRSLERYSAGIGFSVVF